VKKEWRVPLKEWEAERRGEREDEEEGTCQALEMGVVVLLVCPPFTSPSFHSTPPPHHSNNLII